MTLSTSYLSLPLASPLVASASPLTGKVDSLRQLEDAGAAAVVLPSVFEEQLHQEEAFMDHFLSVKADEIAEAQSFFPDPQLYEFNREHSLQLLEQAKAALNIPVIASLNGSTPEGWSEFAKQMVQAGADALELNLYEVAADPRVDSQEVENRQLDTVREVCAAVSIPVSIKIGSHYSALANMAQRFEEAGASGLVLFNRFYQPDFDIDSRTVSRRLGLSHSREMLLPMSWIAILRSQRTLDLAATTGVHGVEDVLKYLMAGANVVMSTSALLQNGPSMLTTLNQGLTDWLHEHGYQSVDELRGCMRREYVDNPELFERANYIKLLSSYI
ncbi:MAG: dihydroorotate dehydrogenase-like protein [Kiritimatiellae bacterium]|jgi:dihydroorotate dehydrogenase (fumarate)|nr:dihydroorotate dehydrogenase-like protein [Kiritimatiellia bacterium]